MRKLAQMALLAAAFVLPANADIERKAIIDCENNQICFYIWPALPDMPGWHQDEDASLKYGAIILAPDGTTFRDAPTVLSGNSVAEEGYKTDHPGPSALDSFIQDDDVNTRKSNPDAVITELDAATSADGHKLRVFEIRKMSDGHSQMLAFTGDGDQDGKFFCVLMMDSTSDKSFETGKPVFREMIAKYKHYKGAK